MGKVCGVVVLELPAKLSPACYPKFTRFLTFARTGLFGMALN
ncbi:MAG: hypothetical protein AVDCRST_MAG56-4409 [uncultured Cytophagales bacterium]|uniref:Uncharacterized protein n=1 Tax=uncultured Cytophagales bacterium TaxID=158755 RepID=A0A6J4JW84_9SPHI|nr:MAG: hypothetical protein AVDCRST_MAG56-4409 [uncultured Cytophagales bacterium]